MAHGRAISARMALDAANIEASLGLVITTIQDACSNAVKDTRLCKARVTPRLIAVTKTKPAKAIQEAYNCGQRHFGENYVQELFDKASQFKKEGINDIKWHFIGHLQRNKSNLLCSVPSLYMVQTVDNTKLADALNKSWGKGDHDEPLKILVQVNTSEEESKSGCPPSECSNVVGHIINSCPHLKFGGLMTIGSPNHDYNKGDNPDFMCLKKCKLQVVNEYRLDTVELSMGMSSDYAQAVEAGADYVRVGSLIFGSRN